jgi:hypothetical protein
MLIIFLANYLEMTFSLAILAGKLRTHQKIELEEY